PADGQRGRAQHFQPSWRGMTFQPRGKRRVEHRPARPETLVERALQTKAPGPVLHACPIEAAPLADLMNVDEPLEGTPPVASSVDREVEDFPLGTQGPDVDTEDGRGSRIRPEVVNHRRIRAPSPRDIPVQLEEVLESLCPAPEAVFHIAVEEPIDLGWLDL